MLTFEAFASATLQSWRGLAALSPFERRSAGGAEQSPASTGPMAAGAPGHVAMVATDRRALVVFDMVSELDMFVSPGIVVGETIISRTTIACFFTFFHTGC